MGVDSISVIPLGQLVDPERGISYGVVQPGQHVVDGVPIVRVTDIRNGRIDTSNPIRVSPDIERKYQRTRLRGGELLLTLVGTVGETAIVSERIAGWNTARAVGVVPVIEEIGAQWVAWTLQTTTARKYIQDRLNTTVQATLNLRDVTELPIPIPDQSSRRAISSILGALDDKIELNRRMNETLEELARTIFKSWFVDFDPVKAKAEGRQPAGMNADTAALFPSRFVESEVGMIPESCILLMMSEAVSFQEGPGILAKDFRMAGVPLLRLAGLTSGVSLLQGCNFLTPEDLAKRWSHFRLDKGDVLLSTSASLGRVAEVDEEAVGAIPYTGIIRFKPRPGRTERCYVRHHLASSTFQEEVEALGVGSVLRHFGPTHLKRVRLLLPPIAIQQRFSDLVSPLDEAVRQRICESSNLLKLRDSLLRKLISGELRIPEAEKLAEAKA